MMDQAKIDEIIDAVAAEWGVGGIGVGTFYGDFAAEVARRAIAASQNEDQSRGSAGGEANHFHGGQFQGNVTTSI